MLYSLLYHFVEDFSFLNVLRYITFRTFLAGITSFGICLFMGPWFIRKMASSQIKQVVRSDGPQSHISAKSGTPTMGGGLILFSIVAGTLLWADLENIYIWLVLMVTVFYGLIGWIDDYLKISRKNSKGIGGKTKLLMQILGACIFVVVVHFYTDISTNIRFPFLKSITFDLGYFFIPFVLFVLVGTSNAVNLTDGLDGLAIGPVMTTAFSFLILAYCAGHFKISEYLQIPYVRGVGEVSVFCSAVVMSGLGFLWFNAYPAQVFMGDVGSLALGGALGSVSIFTKNEILLVVIGGVFVLEAISVIVQVFSFKLTGKRMFRMAPLHHHYELKGWAEPKVIVRFWIISIVLAIAGIATIKLR
ncbi:MAG: phospho-N-acetylmuramoyl-pentapeptide-transferase [Oligoflexia bacterium]|nr:phospho-N-acetylmuramoyl-pentapeptide-transferase [Oligoflexia bacterium]